MVAAGGAEAWAVLERARKRREAGLPIFPLAIGQPEEPPHSAIVQAAIQALHAGRTRYSPLLGEPALRQAVGRARGCAPARVAVLPGAQHALLAALSLILGEGDEVVTPDPFYATYPTTVAAAGGRLVPVPMDGPDFALDVDRLAAAVGPRTRAILVNTPANPTGRALAAPAWQRLAQLCTAHGLWLVADEVYGHLMHGRPFASALTHGPAEATIVIDSLSKSHGMTGFRLGWAIAPERLLPAFEEWSAAALFGVAQFVQDAGVAALALPEAELAPYRTGFARRARLALERLKSIPGLDVAPPDGGMFLFVDVRRIAASDVAFALDLLEEEGVAVMPGSGFGAAGCGFVRLSLTPSEPVLAAALDRLARFVARRRP
ncbi:MAG: pyridoxal phosphate-dependent aminotransferase [Sphingomonadaceae bacterium]|uniref:pyridoxal phosphate-dependent aminotransferase n=1 Tax=Thermaurantiacus sp. TaxID=2820283 RepID=UPI00298F24B2|nr:pyridoxal phosphate-dependent aminotransferase [Thermaurantiacus sp.]MCS6987513.1 pyridoxal phosphate-dependent aminotransferase [Sphingomonadaceae bacterium]MDW8415114.1 pyridoxal phosphate-dependent aminotransferase [Thermaurantiacus sp.]